MKTDQYRRSISDGRIELEDGSVITITEQDGSLAGEDGGRLLRLRRGGYVWVGFETIQYRDDCLKRCRYATLEAINNLFDNGVLEDPSDSESHGEE